MDMVFTVTAASITPTWFHAFITHSGTINLDKIMQPKIGDKLFFAEQEGFCGATLVFLK
ncbi:MAG: hypothetical protein Q8L62_00855 [Candidatus Nitrotoga sp.]|nr:hypothetical protein [Candidatus Nitrotoga sp.]